MTELYICHFCCSVAKSCLTPHSPMEYSTPAPPSSTISWYLLKFSPLSWKGYLISSSSATPFCLQSFPASGSFPMSQLLVSSSQDIGGSASASVLSMNIQDWFPLGLTGLISLQPKGLSRVFYSTTVWTHQFFSTQVFFIVQILHQYMTTGKTTTFTIRTFVGKVMSPLFICCLGLS